MKGRTKKIGEVIADIMSAFGFVARIALDNGIKLGELQEMLTAVYTRAETIKTRQAVLPKVKK